MNILRLVFAVVGFLIVGGAEALAYNPSINTTVIPYEVYTIDNHIEAKAEYLGKLTGDPQMYEFTIGADASLKLQLFQLETNTPVPFSLIVVRQNNQNAGVAEIGRLKAVDINWTEERDGVLGLSLLESPTFEAEIGPGIYRVEVSTPENFGSYMLAIGEDETSAGYFKTLAHIRTIQHFFGKSIFTMFGSSYVYYPIGIMVLSGLIYMTWRKRKLIQKNA